jgi:hypothetical protein
VTFWDDKKGKVLDTDVIKVNDYFTLNDVTLVDRLRYNILSVSQLVSLSLSMLILMCFFANRIIMFLIFSGKRVCGISWIGNVFETNFSFFSIFFDVLDFAVFF